MDTFPKILFFVWEAKTTGCLIIKTDSTEKKLTFINGNLAIDKEAIEDTAFLKHLLKKKILDKPSVKKCEADTAKKKKPLLAVILDLGILSPQQLWKNLEVFAKHDLFPLFEVPHLITTLISDRVPSDAEILLTVPTLNFIQEGVYRMKNIKLIDGLIPTNLEDLSVLSPDYMDQIDLEPFEEHLLQTFNDSTRRRNLFSSNPLGEKYTKRAFYALLCLGLIGSPPMATPNKPLQEFSAAELQKILDTFNEKCSHIYKSVSKELGPVVLNLMEKSIEDIKPSLSHHFQNIRLGMDGKIDLQSVLKSNIIFSDRETIQLIIKSLNEILTAEILAAKKTLGSEFESTLIKNLEKIDG